MAEIRLPKINKVMLSGRITNEIELKSTTAGKQFVRFTIAVDDNYKDSSGAWQDRSYYINCVIWDKQAEALANNAHKGSAVLVEGKITVNQYEDKDGNKKSDTSVVCSYIQTLDKKESGDTPQPKPMMLFLFDFWGMMETDRDKIQAALAVPFGNTDIEWRIQQAKTDKLKAMAIPYVTARAIQIILDEVMGMTNWKDSYDLITYSNSKGGIEYGFKCQLSLRIDNEWITKEDVAPFTDIEDIKGGCSDALKRAAVKFGIGRDLYKLSEVWVDLISAKDRGDRYELAYYRDKKTDAVFYWEIPTLDMDKFINEGVQRVVKKSKGNKDKPPTDTPAPITQDENPDETTEAPPKAPRPADQSNHIEDSLKEHYINQIGNLAIKLTAKDPSIYTDSRIIATCKNDLHTAGETFAAVLQGCNSEADFKGLEAKFERLLKG